MTIKGYRAAISDTLSFFGKDIGNDKYLSSLIKSFDRDRPAIRSLAPKWNLAWVLNVLSKEPFEPLWLVPMKLLTVKTAFLLAFASARRVGEIHALSAATSCCRINKLSATLIPEPGFMAKNETPSFKPEPIRLQALGQFGNDNQSLALCPVRALRVYLRRTQAIRADRLRLFLSLNAHVKDISKATISRWIVLAVRMAYERLTPRDLSFMRINAHEVRAVSATWAYYNNTSLRDVMQAAFWRAETTFTSFYLRSLQQQAGDLYQLGDLCSAQVCISGRHAS